MAFCGLPVECPLRTVRRETPNGKPMKGPGLGTPPVANTKTKVSHANDHLKGVSRYCQCGLLQDLSRHGRPRGICWGTGKYTPMPWGHRAWTGRPGPPSLCRPLWLQTIGVFLPAPYLWIPHVGLTSFSKANSRDLVDLRFFLLAPAGLLGECSRKYVWVPKDT